VYSGSHEHNLLVIFWLCLISDLQDGYLESTERLQGRQSLGVGEVADHFEHFGVGVGYGVSEHDCVVGGGEIERERHGKIGV
jgi:hypothetical protein